MDLHPPEHNRESNERVSGRVTITIRGIDPDYVAGLYRLLKTVTEDEANISVSLNVSDVNKVG